MKKMLIGSICLVLLLSFTLIVGAQVDSQKVMSATNDSQVSGTVKTIDLETGIVTVVTPDNKEVTYPIQKGTKVSVEKKKVKREIKDAVKKDVKVNMTICDGKVVDIRLPQKSEDIAPVKKVEPVTKPAGR
jgi:hypothetical protein